MVVLAPHFTSLLAFAVSVHALPTRSETEESSKLPLPAFVPRPGELEARGHRHHHHHHHHHHYHKHNRRGPVALDLAADEENDETSEFRISQRRHSHHAGRSLYLEKRKHPHGTKVYADDPVVISGDHNHVHTHTHGGHGHKHGHHHHGHSTKVYADDPLIVSGDGNHVHSHSHKKRSGMCQDAGLLEMSHSPVSGMLFDSAWRGFQHSTPGTVDLKRGLTLEMRSRHRGHQSKPLELTVFNKRGLLDNLVPLLAPVPGIAGVINIVGGLSRAVLSEPLASLIVSAKSSAGTMGIQSANDEQLPDYSINASNSTSTTMYLVPQDGVPANLGPNEKPVLVTMPMLQTKDNTVKLYCASYDPNSASPSQLSSRPCVYSPNAGLDTNSSSTHMSQLFTWNIKNGSINPLWHRQAGSDQLESASTRSVTFDPPQVGGYIIGGAPSVSTLESGQSTPSQFSMIFRAHPTMPSQPEDSTESSILASNASSDAEDPSQSLQPGDDDLDDQNTSSKSVDEQGGPGATESDDESSQGSTMAQGIPASSSTIDQSAIPLATSDLTPAGIQAQIVTSTFTMLVAPSQSLDALGATDSTTASTSPSSTMM
ncbi:hypothetical protein OPQ81_007678 [Rhizoctonia solani]|nr:hypothetical protein OPQ81_007678 [Rhizoctonia solani]